MVSLTTWSGRSWFWSSRAYCAPEVKIRGVEYGPKVDLWSLGVIMYILLVAYHPFDPSGEASDDEMWSAIVSGKVFIKVLCLLIVCLSF